MTGAEILEVMRDHTGVGSGHGGKLCLCGEQALTGIEHTAHVADKIADAVRAQARARKAQRTTPAGNPDRRAARLVHARQLGLTELGCWVTVEIGALTTASGLLLRAEPAPDTAGYLEMELLPRGDAPVRTVLVEGVALVQVLPA